MDFYFFTDQDITSEKNLYVKKISFCDFVKRIQKCFDFNISCAHPYKLCDYKPAYGLIFNELFAPYDFWGYCDMDMVFGDIRKFLSEDVLRQYDKIFVEGHLSLFRNNDVMNNLFKNQGIYPEYNYQEVYSTNVACYFDEYRGMELKCLRKGISVYNNGSIRRNYLPTDKIFRHNGVQELCIWKDGQLFTLDAQGIEKEILYAHICKRKMKNSITSGDNIFAVLPGLIVSYEETKLKEYFFISSGGRWYKYIWYFDRIRKLLKAIQLLDLIKGRKRKRDCTAYRFLLSKTQFRT